MNILLVEDNPGDILLAKEALKEGGLTTFRLDVANDGVEALNFLQPAGENSLAELPDLILLDLNIPKVNGLEVLKTIKSNKRLRVIPVVVFSTSEAQYDINESYRHHANCYVAKPVDFDEFVNVIQSIVSFWSRVSRVPSANS